MDLKEEEILGSAADQHWYYRSKAAAVTRLLGAYSPTKILDVGAGSGFFSRYLLRKTFAETAICVDTSYAAAWHTLEANKRIDFRQAIDDVDVDLVLLMDVLEHVEDDAGLIADYVRKVPTGALFVFSVPAFSFLWSRHDDFLLHKRRYTLPQLERVVRTAGLTVQSGAYYFGFILPIAAGTRLLERYLPATTRQARSQLKRHNPITNAFLAYLCLAELRILPLNRVAGLTVFCLARKI